METWKNALALLAGLNLPRHFKWYAGSFLLLMVAGVGMLVYFTGGIKFSYSHAMYLPVMLGAMFFGGTGGMLFGLLGGLVLGPWMPVNIATGEPQLAVNWVFRAGTFIVIGALFGSTMSYVRQQVGKLRWNACHDTVTGMPNKVYLQQKLAMEETEGLSPFVALAHLNIENYFEITNALGANAGVVLSRQIFERLQKNLSGKGSVAHTDSDRFYLLLTAEGQKQADATIEHMLKTLKTSFMIEEIPVYANVCVGVADQVRDGSSFDALIQKANIALRNAQSTGQEFARYNLALNHPGRDRIALIGEIPEALSRDQFNLHFQPKIDFTSGDIVGVEALLRWEHPVRGKVPPGELISQVENTGLIHQITRWVAIQALKQLKYWRDNDLDIAMSFNISMRNFHEADLIPFLRDQIERFDIPPELLELEITESAVMSDVEKATTILKEIKSLGVSISIDDFGTGHSSLAYLKHLPADSVKIDRTFIHSLANEQADRKIVTAAIAMIRGLGLKTVAEGVEDEETADILRELGCDAAQGFHFCRPEPAELITSLLKSGCKIGEKAKDSLHHQS